MKYIMINTNRPIVFDDSIQHSEVAKGFNATSAGFCYFYGEKVRCIGESLSLGIGVNEKDAEIIERRFYGNS